MGHGPSHHKAQLQLRGHLPYCCRSPPGIHSLVTHRIWIPAVGTASGKLIRSPKGEFSQTLSSSRGGWWCLCRDHLFPLSPSSLKDLHLGISKPGPDLTKQTLSQRQQCSELTEKQAVKSPTDVEMSWGV